uniref:Ricin B-type lectin domain-containing protein n=1 Tax=Ascaris lumbricoides TaxID=6252 RepID=A0A0M3HLX5_ASCLU
MRKIFLKPQFWRKHLQCARVAVVFRINDTDEKGISDSCNRTMTGSKREYFQLWDFGKPENNFMIMSQVKRVPAN